MFKLVENLYIFPLQRGQIELVNLGAGQHSAFHLSRLSDKQDGEIVKKAGIEAIFSQK